MRKERSNATAPPKVLKNKKADRVGIKTGLCPDAIQRRKLLAYKRLCDSAYGLMSELLAVFKRS